MSVEEERSPDGLQLEWILFSFFTVSLCFILSFLNIRSLSLKAVPVNVNVLDD